MRPRRVRSGTLPVASSDGGHLTPAPIRGQTGSAHWRLWRLRLPVTRSVDVVIDLTVRHLAAMSSSARGSTGRFARLTIAVATTMPANPRALTRSGSHASSATGDYFAGRRGKIRASQSSSNREIDHDRHEDIDRRARKTSRLESPLGNCRYGFFIETAAVQGLDDAYVRRASVRCDDELPAPPCLESCGGAPPPCSEA